MASHVRALGTGGITCEANCPDLRFMRYRQDDGTLFLFFNESVFHTVDTIVTLNIPPCACMRVYNAQSNTAEYLQLDHNAFRLCLEPGQALVFEPLADPADEASAPISLLRQEALEIAWRVSTKAAGTNTAFEDKYRFAPGELPNLNGPEFDTRFSGV